MLQLTLTVVLLTVGNADTSTLERNVKQSRISFPENTHALEVL